MIELISLHARSSNNVLFRSSITIEVFNKLEKFNKFDDVYTHKRVRFRIYRIDKQINSNHLNNNNSLRENRNK